MAVPYRIGDEAFDQAVADSGRRAFEETLADGQPVFYLDAAGLNVMELPEGVSKSAGSRTSFRETNYDFVRELKTRAA